MLTICCKDGESAAGRRSLCAQLPNENCPVDTIVKSFAAFEFWFREIRFSNQIFAVVKRLIGTR